MNLDPSAAPALGAVLREAGYDENGLASLWGASAAAALERHNRVPAVRATERAPRPLSTLVRVFRLGEIADAPSLSSVGLDVAGLLDAGVLEPAPGAREGEVRAALTITPFAPPAGPDLLILADHDATTRPGPLREDHVLGVGGASRTLASITVRERVRDLLDLGTGCGIQALLAAPFAESVVATDISKRALAIAAFNCSLNGVENVRLRQGSLFEPVAGERFDQIVSNPPFVITPRDARMPTFEYRDAGRSGDSLVAEVFSQAARHLRAGGRAQFLGNWEYRPGRAAPVREWVPPGAHAWVVERQVTTPSEYAETWVRDSGLTPSDAAYRPMLEAWLDDFDARGVEAIGFGWVMLTAPEDQGEGRETSPRLLFETVDSGPGDNPAGLGSHLALSSALGAFMASLGDAEVAALRYRLAPDVREERIGVPGQDHPEVIVVRQGAGLARSVRVDTAVAAFLGACDGELTLGAIASALAQLLGQDSGALQAALSAEAREFARLGFLHPLADADADADAAAEADAPR